MYIINILKIIANFIHNNYALKYPFINIVIDKIKINKFILLDHIIKT